MLTKYLYIAAAAGFLAAISVTGYFAYSAGIDHERAKNANAIDKEKVVQLERIAELEKQKAKVAIVYREKIKVVREVADPTGCSDSNMPDDLFKQLRPDSTGKARVGAYG